MNEKLTMGVKKLGGWKLCTSPPGKKSPVPRDISITFCFTSGL